MEAESAVAAFVANANFSTDFDVDKDKTLLSIKNKGRVNRALVTQEQINNTSFSATLHRVQYGKYQGETACLISLDCSFRFKSKSLSRYEYAEVQVEFETAVDTSKPRLRSSEPLADPRVVNYAPKEVYGIVTTVDQRKHWKIEIPLMFHSPIGLKAGLTGSGGSDWSTHEDNRIEIHGNFYQDDEHDEGANGVTWDLQENKTQHYGIFRSFRSVIMVKHQAARPFWMRVSVKPAVRFSLDLRRLVTKNSVLLRLLQRNDDPVLLDCKTPLKGQPDFGCDDFSSDDFPWARILQMPQEYEVSMAQPLNFS